MPHEGIEASKDFVLPMIYLAIMPTKMIATLLYFGIVADEAHVIPKW